jgi:hypothetical protein
MFAGIGNNILNSSFILSTSDFHFFSDDSSNVYASFKLIERNQDLMWYALFGLTVSFFLLAFSRFGSSNFVQIFLKVFKNNSSINKIIQDEYDLRSAGSFILLLNFVVTSTTLLYLGYVYLYLNDTYEVFYFLPILPAYFILWPLIWYSLIGFFTKESAMFLENKRNLIVLSQLMGVLFSLLLLLWTFNIKWGHYFILVFISIVGFFWLYKIFRGFLFSFSHKISWYYIILYFCTLEILPIIAFYLYLRGDFTN